MSTEESTIYEMIGGEQIIKDLVWKFYAKVEADDELRAIFPADLEPGKRYQHLFLMHVFGGPSDYMAERGHPRMRMRHMPFPINQRLRDLWLQYMLEAIDEVGITEPARSAMRDYFERGSQFMINQYNTD